ncbi:unnamed protein product [Linum tenue]|uniref:Uncharacterized protein n=1 Tax=Linum tenue TaxID=586396 RepID=A0AAV0QA22_9ROSI|nr:unnamed protein product [Linum tenue]
MAEAYEDEEEVWKCAKHPPRSSRSRRPRYGICHRCLRERLAALCPHCGDARRPCSCGACSSTAADSSSSSSTIKRSGSVSRISNFLFESSSSNTAEPSLRRSRSLAVAIPFLRSKAAPTPAPSFWSILKGGGASAKKNDGVAAAGEEEDGEQLRRMMMRKSRSVAVTSADAGRLSWKGSGGGRGWHFPSPMKVFRQSKISARGGGGGGLMQGSERSPLDRG